MRKWTALPSLVLIASCLCPLTAVAQDSAELLARMKAMEDRIKSLEAEVQTLKSQQAAAPATPTVAPSPAAAQAAPEAVAPQVPVRLGGAGGGAAQALNPEIAVIVALLGAPRTTAH